jgi:hypothetical protein
VETPLVFIYGDVHVTLPNGFSLSGWENRGSEERLAVANTYLLRVATTKQTPGFRVNWGSKNTIFFASRDGSHFDLKMLETHLMEASRLAAADRANVAAQRWEAPNDSLKQPAWGARAGTRRPDVRPALSTPQQSPEAILCNDLERAIKEHIPAAAEALGTVSMVTIPKGVEIRVEVKDHSFSRNNFWRNGKETIEGRKMQGGKRFHVFSGHTADHLCRLVGVGDTVQQALNTRGSSGHKPVLAR